MDVLVIILFVIAIVGVFLAAFFFYLSRHYYEQNTSEGDATGSRWWWAAVIILGISGSTAIFDLILFLVREKKDKVEAKTKKCTNWAQPAPAKVPAIFRGGIDLEGLVNVDFSCIRAVKPDEYNEFAPRFSSMRQPGNTNNTMAERREEKGDKLKDIIEKMKGKRADVPAKREIINVNKPKAVSEGTQVTPKVEVEKEVKKKPELVEEKAVAKVDIDMGPQRENIETVLPPLPNVAPQRDLTPIAPTPFTQANTTLDRMQLQIDELKQELEPKQVQSIKSFRTPKNPITVPLPESPDTTDTESEMESPLIRSSLPRKSKVDFDLMGMEPAPLPQPRSRSRVR